MNKKTLYTSLAALALASTQASAFADEVDSTIAEPTVAEVPAVDEVAQDAPAAEVAPDEPVAEAVAEEAPADVPAEEVVEDPAEAEVTTRAVEEEAQQVEVADAPAAASAGEENQVTVLPATIEYRFDEVQDRVAVGVRVPADVVQAAGITDKRITFDLDEYFLVNVDTGERKQMGQYVSKYGGGWFVELGRDGDETSYYGETTNYQIPDGSYIVHVDSDKLLTEYNAVLKGSGPLVVKNGNVEVPNDIPAEPTVEDTPSSSTWVAGRLSGGVDVYATRVVLTDSTTGEVLYDGSPENMTGWSDLLVRLGLPSDLPVGNQVVGGGRDDAIHYGSVELPTTKEELTPAEATKDVATTRNELLLDLDASNLTDAQKSELAEKIAFAETAEELAALQAEFTALVKPAEAPVNETVKVPVTTKTDSPAPVQNAKPTYSRTSANHVAQAPKSDKGFLPSTGEAVSILGLVGAGLSALGLVGLKRRRK